MNERYTLLYDQNQVRQAIGRIASEITAKHQENDPLFVCLLRGGAPFATRLATEMTRQAPDFHPEVDYMTTVRFGGRDALDEVPLIKTDLSPETEVENRDVVILDVVLDAGVTAEFTRQHLLDMGARYVELAVLVDKEMDRVARIEADYTGFRTPNQWLAGMGMKDLVHTGSPDALKSRTEGFRWRDSIWTITPDGTHDRAPLVTPLVNA